MNKDISHIKPVITDAWSSLKSFTRARIALGKSGISVPVNEMLQFKMDHAHARDAVFSLLDIDALLKQCRYLIYRCMF